MAIKAFDRPQRKMEPNWGPTNSDQLGHIRPPEEKGGFSKQTNSAQTMDFYSGDSEGQLCISSSFPFVQTTIMANSKVHLFAMIDMIFGPAMARGNIRSKPQLYNL